MNKGAGFLSSEDGVLDEKKLVPLRWVFVSVGVASAALGSVIVGALTIGGWTSRVSLGQQEQDKRISVIEDDRKERIKENEIFERSVISQLSAMDTKMNILLNRGNK